MGAVRGVHRRREAGLRLPLARGLEPRWFRLRGYKGVRQTGWFRGIRFRPFGRGDAPQLHRAK